MPHGMVRWLSESRIGTALARRPRLTITLVMLVLLVVVQGGAVAGDGTLCETCDVSTSGGTTGNTGP